MPVISILLNSHIKVDCKLLWPGRDCRMSWYTKYCRNGSEAQKKQYQHYPLLNSYKSTVKGNSEARNEPHPNSYM